METNRRDFIKYIGVATATSTLLAAGVAPAIASGNDNAEIKKPSPIFDSVKIGSLTLKNRIIQSAMAKRRSNLDGSPNPDIMRVYNESAAGGAAMLITGLHYILEEDQFSRSAGGFYSDSQIQAYKEFTDGVHKNGSKICIQLVLNGSKGTPGVNFKAANSKMFAPAPYTDPSSGLEVKEGMTKEEIKYCIDAHAKAAVRAQEAGFDAIELHYAHDYMPAKFFLPYFNTRTDEYGGKEIENRARFPFEILEAVRKAVGKDFPLIAKINSTDFLGRPGNTQKDIDYIAQGLADRGIDALDITGGTPFVTGDREKLRDISLYSEEQSYFARYARTIAKSVKVPMILTGGNRDVGVMETALKHNKNLVAFGMARTLLCEPDLPLKWQKDPNYAPKCESCNWCHLTRVIDNVEITLQCKFRRDKA